MRELQIVAFREYLTEKNSSMVTIGSLNISQVHIANDPSLFQPRVGLSSNGPKLLIPVALLGELPQGESLSAAVPVGQERAFKGILGWSCFCPVFS